MKKEEEFLHDNIKNKKKLIYLKDIEEFTIITDSSLTFESSY